MRCLTVAVTVVVDVGTVCAHSHDLQVLQELLALSKVLDAFPLPPNTAEAAMVGASTEQRASLQFRKAVFLTFGAMNRAQAGAVAEMLGFDPELVVPSLGAAA